MLPLLVLTGIFVLLMIFHIIQIISKKRSVLGSYLNYIWLFFLIFLVTEFLSFSIAAWIWGFLCFLTLREYFTLVDMRLQDRFGIWAAYLSVPFMLYFINIDWYGMFIISIPVYSFLVIPLLVSLGGKESEGAIISIGTIDFGLFLLVFCMGHIAYLSYFSTWLAAMLILNTVICNISYYFIDKMRRTFWRKAIFKYGITAPVTISLALLLTSWTDLSVIHSVIVGAIIPALVIIGNHTVEYLESDLGIDRENLRSGKGLIIDNLKSVLYSAPIFFHYIRYFTDIL